MSALTRRCVGMTCTEGIYVDDRRVEAGDCSGPLGARAILHNPEVEMAVLETARGGILRAGLGFDRCDVAVVTNIGEGDHLGVSDVWTLEQLAKVKRTPVTWCRGTVLRCSRPTTPWWRRWRPLVPVRWCSSPGMGNIPSWFAIVPAAAGQGVGPSLCAIVGSSWRKGPGNPAGGAGGTSRSRMADGWASRWRTCWLSRGRLEPGHSLRGDSHGPGIVRLGRGPCPGSIQSAGVRWRAPWCWTTGTIRRRWPV